MPPISETQAHQVKIWMMRNFGPQLMTSIQDKPFDVNVICAIAGKEAALYWLNWIDTLSPQETLARCVFDASGDAPNTSRVAFPQNTQAFIAKFGTAFGTDLIDEANKTRQLRHLAPANWVYKGYGIFQYDLQFVLSDEAFFRQKQWGDFQACLDRAVDELVKNYTHYKDLRTAIRAYNGSGAAAEQYADDVMRLLEWCSEA